MQLLPSSVSGPILFIPLNSYSGPAQEIIMKQENAFDAVFMFPLLPHDAPVPPLCGYHVRPALLK